MDRGTDVWLLYTQRTREEKCESQFQKWFSLFIVVAIFCFYNVPFGRNRVRRTDGQRDGHLAFKHIEPVKKIRTEIPENIFVISGGNLTAISPCTHICHFCDIQIQFTWFGPYNEYRISALKQPNSLWNFTSIKLYYTVYSYLKTEISYLN
jgi:hypothetical protein